MVDFSQWPMVDFLQRFKPREYAQHTSLPFQGKGWGMGSKKAWESRRAIFAEQRVFIRQLVPAGTEPLTVLRTALADLGERYPAVVPVRALVAEVLGEDGW